MKLPITIQERCRECGHGTIADDYGEKLTCPDCKGKGTQTAEIYALRDFEKNKLRVLVACEESQAVCIAFRELGHEAFSCDILPCSGGHPEWHIQDDVLKHLDDGWDLMIAHPPCTYLAVSGARWFKEILPKQEDAIKFFMALVNAPIEKKAIENPVCIMSNRYRKPDQIIQPFQFSHGEMKATCLWLEGLPLLKSTDLVEGREQKIWKMPPSKDRKILRSKTYPGIAKAMAQQWGGHIIPKSYEPYEIKKVSEITEKESKLWCDSIKL